MVLADLRAWYPHLAEGGILCGDDWKYYREVREAVRIFAKEQGLSIVTEGNFWRLT
ncbi:MAG: hypothetical protein JSR80_05155 [Verrucomicrobia bacterium]|nr:hypothetical protein [Verrucomicrobiota bacterium]